MAITCILCLKDKDGKPLLSDDAETLNILEGASDAKLASRIAMQVLGVPPAAKLGN